MSLGQAAVLMANVAVCRCHALSVNGLQSADTDADTSCPEQHQYR